MEAHELATLDAELKKDFYGLDIIEEMKVLISVEIRRRMSQKERGEILGEGLSWTGSADKFYAFFKANASIHTFSIKKTKERMKSLRDIFLKNAESIKKWPFSFQQIKHMNDYMKGPEVATVFLEGVLERIERGRGNVDDFFYVFRAVSIGHHSQEEQRSWKIFLNNNTEAIKKLPFSIEQIEYINEYANDSKVTTILLEGALERAGGNANKFFDTNKFFDVFKAIAGVVSSHEQRMGWKNFFNNNDEVIKKLPFSIKQIKYIKLHVDNSEVTAMLLEGAFERAGRDANNFFSVLEAIASLFPTQEEQRGWKNFFLKNADTILLSDKQIRYIERYIGDSIISNKTKCAGTVQMLFDH